MDYLIGCMLSIMLLNTDGADNICASALILTHDLISVFMRRTTGFIFSFFENYICTEKKRQFFVEFAVSFFSVI